MAAPHIADRNGAPLELGDRVVTNYGREAVLVSGHHDSYGWDLELRQDDGFMFWAAADTVDKVS